MDGFHGHEAYLNCINWIKNYKSAWKQLEAFKNIEYNQIQLKHFSNCTPNMYSLIIITIFHWKLFFQI